MIMNMASHAILFITSKIHAFHVEEAAFPTRSFSPFSTRMIAVRLNSMKMWRRVRGGSTRFEDSAISRRAGVCKVEGWYDTEINPSTLDPLLRQKIVQYGDLVTACYKTFDVDPTSKRYLNTKYGKNTMMEDVGLGNYGYDVTKYIYASSHIVDITSEKSRWIGYVAVTSDDEVRRLGRRDLVISFRGTVTYNEWLTNFMSILTPARLNPSHPQPEVKVEAGFLNLYTSYETVGNFGLRSCREQLLAEISRLVKNYKGEKMSITVAGHSMGSSLALLLAYDIAELELNEEIPITVFSFAGPRVGNLAFKERLEELGVNVLRIVNVYDPITKFPGLFLNENFRFLHNSSSFCYAHVGTELALDFFNIENPSCVHDLESHIRLLRSTKVEESSRNEDDILFHDRAKQIMLLSVQNLVQFGMGGLDHCLNLFHIILLLGGIYNII